MKKGDEDVARELPEKYRRLNEKAFADAKKAFDGRYGEYFSHERLIAGKRCRREQSWADTNETRLKTLIDRYKEKSFSLGDGDRISPRLVAEMYLVDDQLLCDAWIATDDESYPDFEKGKDGGFGKDIAWHDTDEMKQAARIRSLFTKLVETGGRMAHELNSNTYPGWQELYICVAEHYPYNGQYMDGDEFEEYAKPFWAFRDLHRKLWADLQIMGKANAPKRELGEWAKRFVADYDAKHGFIELMRGQQRSFRIPETSAKAWDILTRLFTANDAEGWAKLPPNWKSHFIRKIGSTGEIDRESDLVRIAAFIRPHTPGKGRASDGKYRFEPIRRVRENLK